MRYLDDFTIGELIDVGPYRVSEQEMLEFSARYDPQEFHIDPDSERTREFGGLIASGWHTAAIFMRMAVDGYMRDTAILVSPGVDGLRWLHPVKAEDVLAGVIEVTGIRHSKTRPDRGILTTHARIENQDHTPVMTIDAKAFVKVRPDD